MPPTPRGPGLTPAFRAQTQTPPNLALKRYVFLLPPAPAQDVLARQTRGQRICTARIKHLAHRSKFGERAVPRRWFTLLCRRLQRAPKEVRRCPPPVSSPQLVGEGTFKFGVLHT